MHRLDIGIGQCWPCAHLRAERLVSFCGTKEEKKKKQLTSAKLLC